MYFIIFLLALCLGSFANNVISYYIKSSKFDMLRSTCICGKKNLRSTELIPLLSFAIQKGKCRECPQKISFRYPFVELICGILGVICYFKYDITLTFLFNFLLLYLLFIIAVIDLYAFIIPNHIVFVLLLLAVVKFLVFNEIFQSNLLFAVIISVVFISLNQIYIKTKRKLAIGYGDIKLIAVLMLLVNIPFSLLGLWLSSLIAIPGYFVLKRIFPDEKFSTGKIPLGFFLWLGYNSVIFFS